MLSCFENVPFAAVVRNYALGQEFTNFNVPIRVHLVVRASGKCLRKQDFAFCYALISLYLFVHLAEDHVLESDYVIFCWSASDGTSSELI